ncbi:serine/threonine-protein kinase [Streptomyces cupreus]|uniref:Serine/threonine protein kinase n=1 Tax=Streptomyces cupreus TaxID=2759956 RepID=A0A7X1M9S9_9ACTN|nr:serine/threonine-protein kinase [Streptomyces cupreus]MBC2903594.1 serine/threonine protein kinase [Streptomyces cupreus]
MDQLGPGDPLGVPPGIKHWGKIGAYRLIARLGAGGMGRVYLARSERGRTVAVKLVREELAAQEEFRARFRQEVEAARQVGGYWTAPVLDADTEAPVPWVATGYVAGPSLQQVVGHDHGALPERSVRILAAGLAHALTDIHAAGIVHRDLKPSNVLVTIDGPRVIDFGIARALETVAESGLTRTGALVGSPGFMAPEQVRGDRITPACDVFCLGSVLAYAATGRLPFGAGGSGAHAQMFRIAQEEPDLEGVPEGIADLVRDCLRKDPGARPTLARILERTGVEDTVSDGRSRDPWLPSALVAQLGRHAVGLLEAEEPASPEHAPAADESESPAPGPAAVQGPPVPGQPGVGGPMGHLPTVTAPLTPPAAPPPGAFGAAPAHPAGPQPAQGHPAPAHPAPAHPAYGYPHPAYQPPPPAYSTPPYGPAVPPPQPPRRSGRSTALLLAVALVVAVAAGGSVYALMNGSEDDGSEGTDGKPTSTPQVSAPVTPGPTTEDPSPTASETSGGPIPADYLGTWSTTLDNDAGLHTRHLTLQQGEVGDTVLSLVADGADYHCVFQAKLAEEPTGDGPLEIGPSTVSVGEPASSCTPGAATELTLLGDGSLERVNTSTGERLTYTRE